MKASRRQILCRGLVSTGALAGGMALNTSLATVGSAGSFPGAAHAPASHTSNRLEIIDVLSRYSYAVDHRDWEAFDQIFAPGAIIDLTHSQEGRTFPIAEFRKRLISGMGVGTQSQHLLRNTVVLLKGRSAQAVSELIATARVPLRDGKTYQLRQLRAAVFDDLTPTPSGWRIARRTVYAKGWELLPPNNRDWQPLIEATKSPLREIILTFSGQWRGQIFVRQCGRSAANSASEISWIGCAACSPDCVTSQRPSANHAGWRHLLPAAL